MRVIDVSEIRSVVTKLISRAAFTLPEDYLQALRNAQQNESNFIGRSVLDMLVENAQYAEAESIPTCQDTGMAIIYLEIGQDVHFTGGLLAESLDDAVRDGYRDLRKSVVDDPLLRQNTGDNTPPILHYSIVPGENVTISLLMKGFGAELMSRLRMLPAAAGVEGVKEFVLETVEHAGPNACPPVIVGVGLGSTFDGVAELAKKALLRPLGASNPKTHLEQLERELLEAVNTLDVGPQGFGGQFTALAVHVNSMPTHIAALPVAVNLNCSAPRRATVTI